MKTVFVAAAFSLCATTDAKRQSRTINDNWEFKKVSDSEWAVVNIPHTYNMDAYEGMRYYRGKGVYRRLLDVPEIDKSRRYYLRIDAASKGAEVRINGESLGSHAGGYTKFLFDVTDKITDKNEIEITVDNDRPDITPISADFTFFGGIYRDVWLISTPDCHFNMGNMGSDGIFISTPVVSEKEAVVRVRSEVTNDSDSPAVLEVASVITAPDGKHVQTIRNKVRLKAGETKSVEGTGKKIANPLLWSPEAPNLYTVRTVLSDPNTGEELDSYTHHTAFRWFAFDGNKGFSLNGKPYKLRGFNRHQDQWPVGVALPDEAHRRDIELQKELGANFIRIAHYPQDDAVLELCDKRGLLVWEEIPIVNIVPDTEGYADNCELNLREMIRQHYNHPSVIAWGYMNEILLTAPQPGKPGWEACRDRTVALARRLERALKEEDPSRASVMAYNMTNLYNEIGLDLIDVSGWNLYHGWYVGQLGDFNKWCEEQHERYPERPVIISEWGAGSDRRLHTDNGRPFDFSIEYQHTYVEHYLPFIEETEWICGCSYWNFIDFNVAARQESMPRVNNKGVAYNDRTFKDIAYYFKSMWRKDVPVVHIASRDRAVRIGEDGQKHPVKIYTNLPEVELVVNGVGMGKKAVSNCSVTFEVEFPKGRSTLIAKGYDGQDRTEDCMTVIRNPYPCLSDGGELAINVGGNCDFTSDLSNLTWLSDRPYTPGKWGYVGGKERSTTSEIKGTVDGPVYQTWREGDFTYRVDAPAGEYEVELLMADVSRPAAQLANLLARSNSEKEQDMARFDVLINGQEVERDFSPVVNGHFRTAFKRRYIVDNNGEGIRIDFRAVKGKPYLSGLKIRKI
ncbi:MAG: malectin domain-containing carbohydrate-binding protein [Bacteroides sp.]|nr:malectin domain-containing carbohydrate-binding protein [Roseburia sp.]MCM1347119.1 malectin domain-containing carbohydrate-binding protein [Bacteroides sp.]MCM1421592.1 malectin domain-containing carbohydrate-binding protein [Bacteroides sp.]